MEIKVDIPYLHDIDSVKDTIERMEIKERQEKNGVLKAKIKTEGQDKEKAKKLLKEEYKPTQSEFTEFTETIKEPPFNTDAFKKGLETYEDAMILTGTITDNLMPKATDAKNGFSSYLGSDYLFDHPISGCSSVANLSASILRDLGIETAMVKGLSPRPTRKKYTQNKSAEHTWNIIKIQSRWIEIDFTKNDYGFLKSHNIPLLQVKEPVEYLGRYLRFSREVEYLDNTFEILEED